MLKRILITGVAGFIGFHLARRCLADGFEVLGVDNLNDYYDVTLKESRLSQLAQSPAFTFEKIDIVQQERLLQLLTAFTPDYVVHLAAQAGVRHALRAPHDYVHANLAGFVSVMEAVRHHPVKHLLFASSSSAYGAVEHQALSEHHHTEHPLSLYAATKKSNELIAHSYASLFGQPVTGLRFFTAYGPWGRPDMALFIFTRRILAGEPIAVFNQGNMMRDFTYIDDVVDGVMALLPTMASPDPQWQAQSPNPDSSYAPYRIYNIGRGNPVGLMDCIALLEKALDRSAILDYQAMQPGDVATTCADISAMHKLVGYAPKVSLAEGIRHFVDWYMTYYDVEGSSS